MLLKMFALALTALILVPSGAHFFELYGKIGLPSDSYFTVQAIYAGWAWFAVPILLTIALQIVIYLRERRRDATAAGYSLISAALVVCSLGIFFGFVFPGNQATANWTVVPENWEALRRSWEYGHAANAVLIFAAVLATGRALAAREC